MTTTIEQQFIQNLYPIVPTLSKSLVESSPTENVGAYLVQFIQSAAYRKTQNGKLGLSLNALRNYHSFQQHFEAFEKQLNQGVLSFDGLDQPKITAFTQWLLEEKKFSQNYAGRLLGSLKTLCLDAKKNGLSVHPYTQHISGFSQQQRSRIINILTLKDLHAIEAAALDKAHLENVRTWLIIGFWLGQRISDLLSLEPQQLRDAPNGGSM